MSRLAGWVLVGVGCAAIYELSLLRDTLARNELRRLRRRAASYRASSYRGHRSPAPDSGTADRG